MVIMKLDGYNIYYLKKKDIYVAVSQDGKINYYDKNIGGIVANIMKNSKGESTDGKV